MRSFVLDINDKYDEGLITIGRFTDQDVTILIHSINGLFCTAPKIEFKKGPELAKRNYNDIIKVIDQLLNECFGGGKIRNYNELTEWLDKIIKKGEI